MAQKLGPTMKQRDAVKVPRAARPSWWGAPEPAPVDRELRKDRRRKAKAARASRKANR